MLSEKDAEDLKNYYQNRPSELLKALRVISFTRKQKAAQQANLAADDAQLGKRTLENQSLGLKKKIAKTELIKPSVSENLKSIVEGVGEAYKIKKKGLGDLYDDENGWPAQSERHPENGKGETDPEEKNGSKSNASQSTAVVKKNKNWLQIARSGPIEKNGVETLFSQLLASYVTKNSQKYMEHLEKPSTEQRPLRK